MKIDTLISADADGITLYRLTRDDGQTVDVQTPNTQDWVLERADTFFPDYVWPEETDATPSVEERLSALETQNQTLTDCLLEMSETVYA